MTSVSDSPVILPFRHDSRTAVPLLADLRALRVTGWESMDCSLRPYVVYGVPYSGKTFLRRKLQDQGCRVLDTDDIVEQCVHKHVRRFVKRLRNAMYEHIGMVDNAIVEYTLTHPDSDNPLQPWLERYADFTDRHNLKAMAMAEVAAALSKAETYEDPFFCSKKGPAQVVFTNLTFLPWYDAGFFRLPEHAPAHNRERKRTYLCADGELEMPTIGPSTDVLARWYADAFRICDRVDNVIILELGEHICTAELAR